MCVSNKLMMHLKDLEKQEQKETKISKRKDITKIQSEMNEIYWKYTKINEDLFFWKDRQNWQIISWTNQDKRKDPSE